MRFSSQVALVTGGSSGVGRAIALELAREGASVVLVGRRLEALDLVATECRQSGAQATCFATDLVDMDGTQALGTRVLQEFDGVDILVHSAGAYAAGAIADSSGRDFDKLLACNVRAPFVLTQALLPKLIARKGQIVFINSTAGLQAGKTVSQYAATKHALKAIADSLREEVNEFGVRVLSVFLGRTASPMQAWVHEFEGRQYTPERLIQPEQVARVVIEGLALGRQAEITDIKIRPMQQPLPRT